MKHLLNAQEEMDSHFFFLSGKECPKEGNMDNQSESFYGKEESWLF